MNDETKQDPVPPAKDAGTKVRVLVNCQYGQPNDVLTMPDAEAKNAAKAGLVDATQAAVTFAEQQVKPAHQA